MFFFFFSYVIMIQAAGEEHTKKQANTCDHYK